MSSRTPQALKEALFDVAPGFLAFLAGRGGRVGGGVVVLVTLFTCFGPSAEMHHKLLNDCMLLLI